jgi:hypothetical protein
MLLLQHLSRISKTFSMRHPAAECYYCALAHGELHHQIGVCSTRLHFSDAMTHGSHQWFITLPSESATVLCDNVADLSLGFRYGELPDIQVNALMYVILGGGTVAKLALWGLCMLVRPPTDTLVALAEDHLNDVVSNMAAIATAVVAAKVSVCCTR